MRQLDSPDATVECHIFVPVQMFIALGKIVTFVSLTFLIVLFVLKLERVGALRLYAQCVLKSIDRTFSIVQKSALNGACDSLCSHI